MSKRKSWLHEYCKEAQRGLHEDENQGRLFRNISMLAKNRFEWGNLPKGIESRHIERFLYEHGQVAFYYDELKGYMCLPCTVNGGLNVYGDPVNYKVTGIGYSEEVKGEDMIRIISNDEALPPIYQVEHYTMLIDSIERTMFMNLNQQKMPYIIPIDKNNELTIKNMLEQVDNCKPAIMVDKALEIAMDGKIKVLQTPAPYLLDKLQEYKVDTLNELLTWLGINNMAQNKKKERMITDEVNVNNEHIQLHLEMEYKNRKKACEEINKKYGLNITVKPLLNSIKEVKENGEIHS